MDSPDRPQMLRWVCEECGGNAVNTPVGTIPEGWEIDDEEDLGGCRAICAECVEDGYSA